jgi:hypothetical protein
MDESAAAFSRRRALINGPGIGWLRGWSLPSMMSDGRLCDKVSLSSLNKANTTYSEQLK